METKAQLAEQSIDHDDNRPRFDSSGARSWLCASSLNLQLFEKARSVAADIAHLDLEDLVPHHDKARARAMLLQHFGSQRPSVTALRINSLRTRDGLKDLLFLIEHAIMPDVIILPKIEVPGDVRLARSILDEARYCRTRLFGVVESVQGWWDLRTRPDCGAGLDGLIFGAADFAADFKVDLHRADFSLIKAEIALIAARLGGIAIDSPCFRMRSETALRRELHEARRLGFVGKVAIYPSQGADHQRVLLAILA